LSRHYDPPVRRLGISIAAVLAVFVVPLSAAGTKPPLTAQKATEYGKSVAFEIAQERKAIALIGKDDETAGRILETSHDRLGMTVFSLGDYTIPGPSPSADLQSAESMDLKAREELTLSTKAGDKAALDAVALALQHKKRALDRLETLAGTQTAERCYVTKPFAVYAVPEGYSGSYNDVFPHGIPKNAKNVEVLFVDLATGKAPAPQLFPGQTWSSQVKGFQPNGKFDVRVNVSGTGFGKPNANSRKWKVVVTYDCP
jgi:hypothetical protein